MQCLYYVDPVLQCIFPLFKWTFIFLKGVIIINTQAASYLVIGAWARGYVVAKGLTTANTQGEAIT